MTTEIITNDTLKISRSDLIAVLEGALQLHGAGHLSGPIQNLVVYVNVKGEIALEGAGTSEGSWDQLFSLADFDDLADDAGNEIGHLDYDECAVADRIATEFVEEWDMEAVEIEGRMMALVYVD